MSTNATTYQRLPGRAGPRYDVFAPVRCYRLQALGLSLAGASILLALGLSVSHFRPQVSLSSPALYLALAAAYPALRFLKGGLDSWVESRLANPGRFVRARARAIRLRARLLLWGAAALTLSAAAAAACALAAYGRGPGLAALGVAGAGGALWLWAARAARDARRRARLFDQGAEGERLVAELLGEPPPGWRFRYGLFYPSRGDVDLVAGSPWGYGYVVEVKSHRGRIDVGEDGRGHVTLFQNGSPIERDFVGQALGQARAVWGDGHYRAVVPLLVFSHARLGAGAKRVVRDCVLLEASELRDFLFRDEARRVGGGGA